MQYSLIALALCLGAASPARAPQSVRVVGTDFAFSLPAHIRAGETLFSFENRGTVRHEMSIVLLKEGVSPDSIVNFVFGGGRRRDFVDGQGALIISAAGVAAGPMLMLDLQRGRSYLVACTLKDTPDAQPHVMLGMVTSFRAE